MPSRRYCTGLAIAGSLMLGACTTEPIPAPNATADTTPETVTNVGSLAYIAPSTAHPLSVPQDPIGAELQVTLLSWAVTLSGLPAPDSPPALRRMPHAFFVKNACNGSECKVLGWFPPGDTVYVDERLDPQNNLLASSIVVHEMVHYLQFRAAGKGLDFSCAQAIALERQAYGAQREFITRYGVYRPVGASMHQVGCDPG